MAIHNQHNPPRESGIAIMCPGVLLFYHHLETAELKFLKHSFPSDGPRRGRNACTTPLDLNATKVIGSQLTSYQHGTHMIMCYLSGSTVQHILKGTNQFNSEQMFNFSQFRTSLKRHRRANESRTSNISPALIDRGVYE